MTTPESISHREYKAEPPSPEMLRSLAQVAFAYASTLSQGMVTKGSQENPVYYLKDFHLKNNQRVGRVARFSRTPLWELGDEIAFIDHYSFYYSERIEKGVVGTIEESWQAFGYRWNEENGLLRARRWTEKHPAQGEPRIAAVSTADDVMTLTQSLLNRMEEAA